jgi:hypothetical protein
MTNVVMSDFFWILGYRSMNAYSISFYETVTGITEKQINNRCIYNRHRGIDIYTLYHASTDFF